MNGNRNIPARIAALEEITGAASVGCDQRRGVKRVVGVIRVQHVKRGVERITWSTPAGEVPVKTLIGVSLEDL